MSNKELTSKAKLKSIIAWAIFDWANSAFPTVITTFIFSTYFSEAVAKNKELGTAQWGIAVGIGGLIIAVISPLLGAIADYEGRRKPWLAAFTLLNIVATFLLWFVKPESSFVMLALTCAVLGTIGLEVGMVFYNAMLNDIVPESYTGRMSGWAWGFGYLGGLCSLIVALYAFVQNNLFSLNTATAEQIRICGPFAALWFAVFALPLFFLTPDQPSKRMGIKKAVTQGLSALIRTLASIRQYKEIVKFILARIFYIDGLNTIFAFGGIYAAGTFGMSYSEVIKLGISMNVTAGLGAALFAWLDDFKGAKPTILIALFIMLFSGAGMLIATSKVWFWVLGLGLSFCVGPVQAASRSLMVHLAPKQLMTEMFGLYALSGKITAFMGPWVLSFMTYHFQSQRIGMSTVIVFLLIGGVILASVKVQRPSY